MDGHDQVPISIRHVLHRDVPQDASVVDEDIDPPKLFNGGLNNFLAIFDAIVVCDGLSTSIGNLFDYCVGHL